MGLEVEEMGAVVLRGEKLLNPSEWKGPQESNLLHKATSALNSGQAAQGFENLKGWSLHHPSGQCLL